ncbi:hypothetical protein L1857_14175 [Amycolatopsis thermalba]|uniref:DUF4352 domain-containing protein n=1 Tax=Amycolatopsis thermalba TaxID=944492 RepID=A0ABY4NV11_9PSEU|nr:MULTISPECIES: hypothetical protein [Amycolatopsis]UQS23896.1 hypothetical protein L1857_14175 [Amycolatopsis thermalba]
MTSQPPGFDPYQYPQWPQPPAPRRNIGAIVALAIAGALVVAGVSVGVTLAVTRDGGTTKAAPAGTSRPRPSTSTSPTPTVPVNPRQNVEVEIGEAVGYGSRAGQPEVVFTLTKVTVGGRCTEPYAQEPENGRFIFLDLTVTTSPSMGGDFAGSVLNPNNFAIIGPDGVTETGGSLSSAPAIGCLSRGKLFPLALSPGQNYHGTIVLDSRNTTGRLVLAPYGLDGFNGWEWNLGDHA